MVTHARMVALVMLVAVAMPAAAQDGPWYDVSCPAESAQVVLDAGHGGPDPGAVRENYGLYERVLTLEVTERAAELLRADGYTVALTRADGATELANSERGEIANRPTPGAAYLELHIEQGPVMDDAGVAVGIVEGILGITWINVVIEGQADHAGPSPMALRRMDCATAAMIIPDSPAHPDGPCDGRMSSEVCNGR